MARIVRSARNANRQRRKLVWADTVLADTAFAVQTNRTTNLLAGFIAAGGSTQGVTIMRIHTKFATAAVQAAVIGSYLSQGYVVDVTGENPNTAPYADWMLNTHTFAGSGQSGLLTAGAVITGEHDIRSKRKCDEIGQSLFHCMLWQPGATGSETTATFDAHFRVLLALP
jgi:hypothetical protein